MLHRALVVSVLCLIVVSCGRSTDGKFGAELYDIACAGCHGGAGEGSIGPPIGTADANAVDLSDEQIFGAIRVGPGAMPGNPRLSDEQITSLVEFLRALQRRG